MIKGNVYEKENVLFGKNLKRIRQDRGLTQSQLGDLLNITDRAISSWEIGRTEPSIAMIDVICDVLHCSKDELLGKKDSDTFEFDFSKEIPKCFSQVRIH